jgi:ubiquinone/menaquinone biosynthesis C-methylase UbiE
VSEASERVRPKPDQKEWLAGVFDRAAPSYDRVGESYHDPFGARLADAARIESGMSVLDVACGRGAVLVPAAERVGSAGRVVGVDLSPEMVNRARDAASAAGCDARIDVEVMDAEHLQFERATFDVALCGFGVFFFPRPEVAVGEMARVVVPGGVVGLSSWADEDERWAWDDELLGDIVVTRRAISQPFDRAADLELLLVTAGLEDVTSHQEDHEIVFATEDQWWQWKWSFSIRGVLEQLDDAARDAYRAAAFEAMQQLRTPSGFPMRLKATLAFGNKEGGRPTATDFVPEG